LNLGKNCHLLLQVILFSLLICCGTIFYPSIVHAGETIEITVSGEAVADDTRTIEDVKNEAIGKARSAAIEQVAGIKIQSETILRDFNMQSSFVAALSTGHIVEEKIKKWDVQAVKKDDNSAPVLIYKVILDAKVALEREKIDPSFKIYTSINRTVFKEGDDVLLTVKTTEDCYLTIFAVTQDNKVFLLLPNKYNKNNLIRKDKVFVYPSGNDISRGVCLKAGLLPGNNKAKEMIRVIATKKPINFSPHVFKEGIGLESFKGNTATLNELIKELVMIPTNERTDAFVAYEIVR
jgi:hypothetical protein